MFQRTLELYYDQLVIGSDLSALSYCYVNKCPAIYMSVDKPYKYNIQNNSVEQLALWNDLAYLISNNKYIPFSDKIVNIRLEEENKAKIITKLGLIATINFEKLIISNDKNIEGLPTPVSKTNYDNWVIDWFNATVGSVHNIEVLEDKEDEFVQKIYFYLSKRLHRNLIKRDIVCVSKITDLNLKDDNYNQNIARLKVLKMMGEAGIKGKWDKTKGAYVKPRIFSTNRDVYPLGKNIYDCLPKTVSILYDTYDSILLNAQYDEKWHKLTEDRYLWNK